MLCFSEKDFTWRANKLFNNSVKNGKKRNRPVAVWISDMLTFIDWYDFSMF